MSLRGRRSSASAASVSRSRSRSLRPMESRGQPVITTTAVSGNTPSSTSEGNSQIGDSVAPLTASSNSRAPRSLSRSSFVGRSRVPVGSVGETRGASLTGRWRSQSRTVRGSVDDSDEAYRAEHKLQWDRSSRSRSRAPATSKLQPTMTTTTAGAAPANAQNPKQMAVLVKPDGTDPRKPPQSLSDYEKRFLAWLPRFISRFLGYRDKSNEGVALIPGIKYLPAYMETWIFAWIGAFLSLATIALVFTHAEPFIAPGGAVPIPKPWSGPVIIGSFGASSVLLFGAPASTLGQPWNFVFGQAISAAAGVAIAKLFELNPRFNYDSLDASDNLVWVAGGCATATALLGMLLTNSVHPPGGATALLAATTPNVTKLGWRYVATALLSGGLMLAWAMLIMNLGRKRYPTHWINGRSPGTGYDLIEDIVKLFNRAKGRAGRDKKDEEEGAASSPTAAGDLEKNGTSNGVAHKGESQTPPGQASSEETLRERVARGAAARGEEASGEETWNDGWQDGWMDETTWQETASAQDAAERTSRWARS